jgi:hypothetical protein
MVAPGGPGGPVDPWDEYRVGDAGVGPRWRAQRAADRRQGLPTPDREAGDEDVEPPMTAAERAAHGARTRRNRFTSYFRRNRESRQYRSRHDRWMRRFRRLAIVMIAVAGASWVFGKCGGTRVIRKTVDGASSGVVNDANNPAKIRDICNVPAAAIHNQPGSTDVKLEHDLMYDIAKCSMGTFSRELDPNYDSRFVHSLQSEWGTTTIETGLDPRGDLPVTYKQAKTRSSMVLYGCIDSISTYPGRPDVAKGNDTGDATGSNGRGAAMLRTFAKYTQTGTNGQVTEVMSPTKFASTVSGTSSTYIIPEAPCSDAVTSVKAMKNNPVRRVSNKTGQWHEDIYLADETKTILVVEDNSLVPAVGDKNPRHAAFYRGDPQGFTLERLLELANGRPVLLFGKEFEGAARTTNESKARYFEVRGAAYDSGGGVWVGIGSLQGAAFPKGISGIRKDLRPACPGLRPDATEIECSNAALGITR